MHGATPELQSELELGGGHRKPDEARHSQRADSTCEETHGGAETLLSSTQDLRHGRRYLS